MSSSTGGPTSPVVQAETTERMVNGVELKSPDEHCRRVVDSVTSPRFLASFLIDARGGTVEGSRHSGVRVIIPPGKVCMPTRITCKLVRSDKLPSLPLLKEGEALVSRGLELGPVGFQFNGPVLIELPHVASLHEDEREIIALRSDDGVSWHEHPVTATEIVSGLLQNACNGDGNMKRGTIAIVCTDFPCYFITMSRVRMVSRMIGSGGGTLKADVNAAVSVVFPSGSVKRDTRVGLQVLPVSHAAVSTVLGAESHAVNAGSVITIEPRRRQFHVPVNLSIPVPTAGKQQAKASKDGSRLRLLYSITGGARCSQWVDSTGSAPMNLVDSAVSFSTAVSARFWLINCGMTTTTGEVDAERLVAAATKVYSEIIAVPIYARFVVLTRSHLQSEAQLRVLCLTDDVDSSTTLEYQQNFHEIARSDLVELAEGKSYSVELSGNLAPSVAGSSHLGITVRAFRVNRLSFIVRVVDDAQSSAGQLKFIAATQLAHGFERLSGPNVCMLPVSLVETKPSDLLPEHEHEVTTKHFEFARQQTAKSRETPRSDDAMATLRLGDIALALQGDWLTMAPQLGVSDAEVIKIQKEYGNVTEQAMMMLHLWIAKVGQVRVADVELALKRIGRDDVINTCIRGNPADESAVTDASVMDDVLHSIDSPLSEHAASSSFDTSVPVAETQDAECKPSDVEEAPSTRLRTCGMARSGTSPRNC